MKSGNIILPHHCVLHVVVDSLPEYEGGISLMQLPGWYPELPILSSHVFEGRRVASVVIVDPVLPLPPQQSDVFAVDDDHVVSGVVHGMVDSLVAALQHPGDHLGRGEGVLPLGVVDVPVTREGCPLLHSIKPRHAEPDQGKYLQVTSTVKTVIVILTNKI